MKTLTEKVEDLVAKKRYGLEELENAARTLWGLFKQESANIASRAAMDFRHGDLVLSPRCGRRMPEGVVGKVLRIARMRVLVDFGTFGNWRIMGSQLKRAPKGSKFKKGKLREIDLSDLDGMHCRKDGDS